MQTSVNKLISDPKVGHVLHAKGVVGLDPSLDHEDHDLCPDPCLDHRDPSLCPCRDRPSPQAAAVLKGREEEAHWRPSPWAHLANLREVLAEAACPVVK